MTKIEEVGLDPRSADGYVVLFRHPGNYTGVLAVPVPSGERTTAEWSALRRLIRSVNDNPKLSKNLVDLKALPQTTGKHGHPTVFEITFAVKNTRATDAHILLFLAYARQARVIREPIVSDMRNFTIT
jgi:hypothetical protein